MEKESNGEMISRITPEILQEKAEVQKEATEEQVMAQILANERNIRAEYMKKVIQLQKEIVGLNTKLTEAHEQIIKMQIDNINRDTLSIWKTVGLENDEEVIKNPLDPELNQHIIRKKE